MAPPSRQKFQPKYLMTREDQLNIEVKMLYNKLNEERRWRKWAEKDAVQWKEMTEKLDAECTALKAATAEDHKLMGRQYQVIRRLMAEHMGERNPTYERVQAYIMEVAGGMDRLTSIFAAYSPGSGHKRQKLSTTATSKPAVTKRKKVEKAVKGGASSATDAGVGDQRFVLVPTSP